VRWSSFELHVPFQESVIASKVNGLDLFPYFILSSVSRCLSWFELIFDGKHQHHSRSSLMARPRNRQRRSILTSSLIPTPNRIEIILMHLFLIVISGTTYLPSLERLLVLEKIRIFSLLSVLWLMFFILNGTIILIHSLSSSPFVSELISKQVVIHVSCCSCEETHQSLYAAQMCLDAIESKDDSNPALLVAE
jgi:hypothetical protein